MSLPARFRRLRLLIVGCGDVGLRVLRERSAGVRALALTSSPARAGELRAAGAVPLVGDLDAPRTLARLAGIAHRVLHLAPPPAQGRTDPRTRALLAVLARRSRPDALVYASTSGVYGDCDGARIDETRRVAPATDRAHRRVDAEARVRWFGRAFGVRSSVLRVPGIYAFDRPGGDPRERVARGTPVLQPGDDVFTNHIHADDLARACLAALFRGRPQRVVHASDDSESRMGEHFELVADLAGLPRPPRRSRAEAAASFPPAQMSFLSDSRRLDKRPLRRELRVRLRHPTVRAAFEAAAAAARR